MAKWAQVPVINGLSDNDHPCQALADVLTIEENGKKLKGLKLLYVGDGNNVCKSLADISHKMGINFEMASPAGFHLKNTNFPISDNAVTAAKNADVVYTDVWASMGQENEMKDRLKVFKPFQVNSKVMSSAKKDAIFLHCLPAHRGEEVSESVIESPLSRVFDQAENRLHVQKAILLKLLGAK
jgi:ornithine carbamoyltransferase